MIPATLMDAAGRRLVTIDRSERLIAAARLFDRPGTRLIIVRDAAGAMAGVVSRTDIVTRISRCTGCTCTECVETAMTSQVNACAPSDLIDGLIVLGRQRPRLG